MRLIISAIGTALALSLFVPTPGVAQTAQSQSMSELTNSCIELAMQRGWTRSDLEVNRREIRNFVGRCVMGREARAQQRPRKQKR